MLPHLLRHLTCNTSRRHHSILSVQEVCTMRPRPVLLWGHGRSPDGGGSWGHHLRLASHVPHMLLLVLHVLIVEHDLIVVIVIRACHHRVPVLGMTLKLVGVLLLLLWLVLLLLRVLWTTPRMALHVHLVGNHPCPGVSFGSPALLRQPLGLSHRVLLLVWIKLLVLLEDKGLIGTSGPVVSGPGHSMFRREPMMVGRNVAASLVVTLGEVGEAAVVAAHPLIVVPTSVAVPRRAVQPPRFGRSIGIQRLPSDGMHQHCHFVLLLLIL